VKLRLDLGPAQVAYEAPHARTPVYVLLGFPVAHSASPRLHAAAFKAAGLDGVYVACAVAAQELPETIAALRGRATDGIVGGANVTVPHKRAVVALLDATDELASLTGAVNTVVVERPTGGQQARLRGCNTDVAGLAAALGEQGIGLRDRVLLVTGSGGMARAAVVAGVQGGARAVWVAARDRDRARELLAELITTWRGAVPQLAACTLAEASAQLAQVDVLVQATTLGMHAEDPLPVDLAAAGPQLFVFDAVYGASPTPLVRAAEARGLRASDGKCLLLHQGAAAFVLWTGRSAPLAAMRQALET
jgi:shikimate dehydrogenase